MFHFRASVYHHGSLSKWCSQTSLPQRFIATHGKLDLFIGCKTNVGTSRSNLLFRKPSMPLIAVDAFSNRIVYCRFHKEVEVLIADITPDPNPNQNQN